MPGADTPEPRRAGRNAKRVSALVLMAIFLLLAFLAYVHRSYPGEVQAFIAGERARAHEPLPETASSASAEHLGAYYYHKAISRAYDTQITEEEQVALDGPLRVELLNGSRHPGRIAREGLLAYTRFETTGDPRFLEQSLTAADVMMRMQTPDGSWVHAHAWNDLSPGWVSAMTQGQGVSLLLRVYQSTEDPRYLDSAERAYECMMRDTTSGGTLSALPDGTPYLELYVGSETHAAALNGSILALLGVRDMALATERADAEAAWLELSDALAESLGYWDTGEWTLYSLSDSTPRPATQAYHATHIALARLMAETTGDPRWSEAAETWLEYRVARQERSTAKLWLVELLNRLAAIGERAGAEEGS